MESSCLFFMVVCHTIKARKKCRPNMGKWMAWIEKLSKAGQYASGEPLLPGGKLITGKKKTVTDGPYTEGKELVGGYFIVNAADINEAVKLCDDYPDYDNGGSVQVRQVMKVEM
ncbi:MAG: YciI family protein [Bacteroidota bacterium]